MLIVSVTKTEGMIPNRRESADRMSSITELRKLREQVQQLTVRVYAQVDLIDELLTQLLKLVLEVRRSTLQVKRMTAERRQHEQMWSNLLDIQRRYESMIQDSLEYHIRNNKPGRVRVAILPKFRDLGLPLPITYGFVNVLVSVTRVQKFLNFINPINLASELDPEHLRDSRGRLYVNLVSFAYCYIKPRAQNQASGWQWPHTVHINVNEDVTDDYFAWRRAGSECNYPVPAPAGVTTSLHVVFPEFCLWPAALQERNMRELDNPAVDYYNFERGGSVRIHPGWSAYSKVEYPLYTYLAQRTPGYQRLAKMIAEGTNIQLICHDAPDVLYSANGEPAPPFNRVLPGVCGENGARSLEITKEVVQDLRKLDLDRMSHGYSLAIALLNGSAWLNG